MTDDLILKASQLQRRADEVIEGLDLQRIWSRIGRVVLVGSVRFGLMTTPNIDLEVYVDQPDVEQGFKAIGQISQNRGVNQVRYLNFINTSDPGYYWLIEYQDPKGLVWEIDNWLVPNDHPHAGLADGFARAMDECLNHETRRIILHIKSSLPAEPKTRGIDIYKAVLKGGVTSLEGFQRWIELNPPAEGIEEWLPGAQG